MFRKFRAKYLKPKPALDASLRKRLELLLGYSNPFAASEPIEPSPASPSDFLSTDASDLIWMFDVAHIPFDAAKIRDALAKDPSPIPATVNREDYFGLFHLAYWMSGLVEYKKLTAVAASYNVTGGNYLDFGGSTGRLFRHFHYQSDHWKVWSCDFKITSVQWNLLNFPSGIQAFQNTYHPVLPVEDLTFDLVTAMSVFTHIDETETTWLLELRRAMKPGGIAILTVHNDEHWPNMPASLRSVIERNDPEFAANATLPRGRFVSKFRTDDPYRCNTFHSNDYIHDQWGRFFEVKEIIPQLSGAQSAVVLQKRH